jgi:hypothetical protein
VRWRALSKTGVRPQIPSRAPALGSAVAVSSGMTGYNRVGAHRTRRSGSTDCRHASNSEGLAELIHALTDAHIFRELLSQGDGGLSRPTSSRSRQITKCYVATSVFSIGKKFLRMTTHFTAASDAAKRFLARGCIIETPVESLRKAMFEVALRHVARESLASSCATEIWRKTFYLDSKLWAVKQ